MAKNTTSPIDDLIEKEAKKQNLKASKVKGYWYFAQAKPPHTVHGHARGNIKAWQWLKDRAKGDMPDLRKDKK